MKSRKEIAALLAKAIRAQMPPGLTDGGSAEVLAEGLIREMDAHDILKLPDSAEDRFYRAIVEWMAAGTGRTDLFNRLADEHLIIACAEGIDPVQAQKAYDEAVAVRGSTSIRAALRHDGFSPSGVDRITNIILEALDAANIVFAEAF